MANISYTAHTVNYNVVRGLPWKRLIILKDRRTHRVLKPTEARSFVKTTDLAKKELTVELTSENGIMLSLTGEETQDLPLGELEYDVLATINDVMRPVAKGTILVTALDLVTPWEEAQAMELRFKQRTDFRRTFTWKDADGEILVVQNAYMQAKDANDNTVLDLRWYTSVPSEATIAELPADQRGYIAPATGATLQVHVSDKNTVAAGTYNFDLFVQDYAGDWDCLSSGTVVVEAAISAPPT
jgi:hypothetical protein